MLDAYLYVVFNSLVNYNLQGQLQASFGSWDLRVSMASYFSPLPNNGSKFRLPWMFIVTDGPEAAAATDLRLEKILKTPPGSKVST